MSARLTVLGVPREEAVKRVTELRASGLSMSEIASNLGIPRSTVSVWLSDPDLRKQKKRRFGYRGTCEQCGGATHGSNGKVKAPALCRSCEQGQRLVWTPERVVVAIQDFAELLGRPPSASDFNPALARSFGLHDRAERFEAQRGRWPSTRTVIKRFGSWNEAIAAAGFTPLASGHRRDLVAA